MAMKQCEIIALTTARKPEATKRLTDLHQLTQKVGLFVGLHKTYQPRDENDKETLPDERQEIQLRAKDVLTDVEKYQGNLYDLIVTQDTGNMRAEADVVLNDGKVLLKGVPVTSLLYLEKQCEDLRKFYSTLPVLDVAKQWEKDESNRCYKSRTSKTRTKRKKIPVVLAEATDKHPAQVTLIEEDYIVGDYLSCETSGALTAAEKAALLERLAAVKDAIVLARERANQTEVSQRKAGEALFKYLHSGLVG